MMEKWCNSQWQTGMKQRCRQTCRINIARKGVSTAEVQIVDKTEIVTMIMSVDDKNHTGLCALGFAFIHHNVLNVANLAPW